MTLNSLGAKKWHAGFSRMFGAFNGKIGDVENYSSMYPSWTSSHTSSSCIMFIIPRSELVGSVTGKPDVGGPATGRRCD